MILTVAAASAPFPETVRVSVFGVAYLLAGGKVLLAACRNIFKGEFFDENFLMTVASVGAFAIGEMPEAVSVMIFTESANIFRIPLSQSRRKTSKH